MYKIEQIQSDVGFDVHTIVQVECLLPYLRVPQGDRVDVATPSRIRASGDGEGPLSREPGQRGPSGSRDVGGTTEKWEVCTSLPLLGSKTHRGCQTIL